MCLRILWPNHRLERTRVPWAVSGFCLSVTSVFIARALSLIR